jgi:hypothetical protein
LADEISPLFLLILAPFSFFFEDPSFVGDRLFLQEFSFVKDHLMGRIKIGTRNKKGCMKFVECLVEWNVLHYITKHDLVEARKSKFNEGRNQPR